MESHGIHMACVRFGAYGRKEAGDKDHALHSSAIEQSIPIQHNYDFISSAIGLREVSTGQRYEGSRIVESELVSTKIRQ